MSVQDKEIMEQLKEENKKLTEENKGLLQKQKDSKKKFLSFLSEDTSLTMDDFPDLNKKNFLSLLDEIKDAVSKEEYGKAEKMILKSYVFSRFLEDEEK